MNKKSELTYAAIVTMIVALGLGLNTLNLVVHEHYRFLAIGLFLLTIIGFIYYQVKSIKSRFAGEPEKDELSSKIQNLACTYAFKISLSGLGIFFLFVKKVTLSTDVILGWIILGMISVYWLSYFWVMRFIKKYD